MVNGIGINNIVYPKKDVETLAKFATGVPLTNEGDKLSISNVASYPLMLSTYEGLGWLKNNRGNYKEAFKQVTQNGKEAYNTLKNSGVKGILRVSDAKEILTYLPEKEALAKLSSSTQNLYSQAQKYAEIAKANPKSADAIKKASSALAQAKAAAYGETAKNATGIFAKTKNALGITKLNQGAKNLAAKSPTFQKCVDAYNNEAGTLMLALEGGIEVATNVVPTFKQLGAKKGFKQLGRSAAKTVTSVAGWVAGSAVGTKLGQIVGAAVGNSKAGAVIGAIAGKVGSYAVGTVGQHYSTKLAEKVLGKSELEKAKEEEAIAIAQEAQNNPQVFAGLIEMAANRIANEGENTAEAKALNASLINLAQAEQTAGAQTTPSAMMTREEMAAYAQKLQGNPQSQVINNPAQQTAQGYVPSITPVQVKQVQNEYPAGMQELLNKTDRMLENASKFVA